MTAAQINPFVWVVGTAEPGLSFTDDYDCVQYLWWDGVHGILVDAGSGRGTDAWLNNVREVAPLEALTGVLLTHYHADHCGGAAAAAEVGLRLFGDPLTARALATGDEQVTSLARARAAGVYPASFTVLPTDAVQPLADGTSMDVGRGRFTAISAPGHCDGHLVYAVQATDRRALFSGDVVFADGRVSIQAIDDCRLVEYADTIAGLAELGIDELYPGHGDAVLSDADRQIDQAARSFARLIPPPNVLTG